MQLKAFRFESDCELVNCSVTEDGKDVLFSLSRAIDSNESYADQITCRLNFHIEYKGKNGVVQRLVIISPPKMCSIHPSVVQMRKRDNKYFGRFFLKAGNGNLPESEFAVEFEEMEGETLKSELLASRLSPSKILYEISIPEIEVERFSKSQPFNLVFGDQKLQLVSGHLKFDR